MIDFFTPACFDIEVRLIKDLHEEGYIVIARLSHEADGIIGLISCSEKISDIVALAKDMIAHSSGYRWAIFMPNGNSVFDNEVALAVDGYIERAANEAW